MAIEIVLFNADGDKVNDIAKASLHTDHDRLQDILSSHVTIVSEQVRTVTANTPVTGLIYPSILSIHSFSSRNEVRKTLDGKTILIADARLRIHRENVEMSWHSQLKTSSPEFSALMMKVTNEIARLIPSTS